MFPGMQGPQPLPDHVAQQQFWKNFNRFLAVTTLTIGVSLAIRHIEKESLDALIGGL